MASVRKRSKRRLARKRALAAAPSVAEAPPQVAWVSDMAFENEETDDGRFMLDGAVEWRDLPLPLMILNETGPGGHEGAVLGGKITSIVKDSELDMDGEPLPEGVTAIRARGVFDVGGDEGLEAARVVGDELMRGVSLDPAGADVVLRDPDTGETWMASEADDEVVQRAMLGELQTAFKRYIIGGATVCPTPAFANARIAIAASGQFFAPLLSTFEILDNAMVAAAPVAPPREWFFTPEADSPAALTVTDEGHVYGHAALWNACHTGFRDRCFQPQPSPSNYAYFNNGEIVCSDGDRVGVGQLTMRAFHASLTPGTTADQAKAHYENTGVCAADVRAVDGVHGVWISGAVRPHLSDADVRELRGAKVSGDWRQIVPGGPLEMIGALEVNTPGFPVPRAQLALAASAAHPEGEPVALIAAGVLDDAGYARRLEVLEARLEHGRDGLAAIIG